MSAALAAAALCATPDPAAACTLTTSGVANVAAGNLFTLNLGAVGTGDGLPTAWTINWGDGTIQPVVGNPASVTHTYNPGGDGRFTYNILASATCNGRTYFQNDLVVPSSNTDEVNWYRHDATTNLAVTRAPVQSGPNAGLTYPFETLIGPDGFVYVSGWSSGNVTRYNPTTGAFIDQFATGGTSASGLAFGPDGHLYVGDSSLGTVRRYNGATGAYINDFVTAGSGGITEPEGVIFGPDGNLYVSDYAGDAVYRYNGATGAFLGIFTSGTAPRDPEDLTFGPNGHLFVASDRDHKVLRYNGTTGAYINDFVTSNSGGLDNAQSVVFGPDGHLYVSSWNNDNVNRYDGSSGVFLDTYVSGGLGGIDIATYLNFIPGHQVTVFTTFDQAKLITIDRSKIPGTCGGTLANYPMLFKTTDPDLAHTGSGGDVTDLQGDDIVFRALDDATCGGAGLAPCDLDHEIESYTSGTGALVAWVRIPAVNTVASGSDTEIYIFYGNSAVTSPTENPGGVWDPNHVGVWHLKEGTGVTAVDSTSNNNSAVPNSGNPTSDTGQIGGALRFASTSRLRIGAAPSLELNSGVTPNWTMSAWVLPTSYSTLWPTIYAYGSYGASMGLSQIEPGTDGRIENWTNDVDPRESNSAVALNGRWHYVSITRTPAATTFYMNGAADGSSGPSTDTTGSNQVSGIGADGNGAIDATEQFLGLIDEVRVSNTARSSCWIAASYHNEVWPDKAVTPSPSPSPNPTSGFYTIGPATAVELTSFTAMGVDGGVTLSWETGSEMDNLGFHLYRSLSASGPWARLTGSMIPGLGSSPAGARYSYRDADLTNGVTYFYVLEDIETTGRSERHGPVGATPASQTIEEDEESVDDERSSSSVITYGDPEANRLRVVKRGRNKVVLELTTEGFWAYPEEDGSVRIEIADFHAVDDDGLPLKQTWVEALAGRQVKLDSVRVREVETIGLRPSDVSDAEVAAYESGVVELRGKRGTQGGKGVNAPDAARLVEVAFQGEVKKALVEMAPLRWDPRRQQLRLAKELTVTLSFAERDRKERVGSDGRRGRRERSGKKRNERDRGGAVVRLATVASGLYGLRYEDVVGGRFRRGLDATRLRLSRLGETVAFHVEPSTSRFAPGSVLYFVSEGADANPYGNEAVFELTYGASDGVRMPVRDAMPSSSVPSASWYLRRDEHEADLIYQAALMGTRDRWMWDSLFAPVTKGYPFPVTALNDGTEPARLEVSLYGGTDFPESPDHHVMVYVNGTRVAERSWNGKLGQTFDVTLWPGVLRDGENLLEVENVGDTGAKYSVVYLDRYVVTYPRRTTADDGVVEGTWTLSGTSEISGVFSGAVVDTTDADPVWLALGSTGSGLRFEAEAEHRYLAVGAGRAMRPEIRSVSSAASRWKSSANQADYVVLAPSAFLEAARPLIEHRRAQGLSALAVPVEDIYAEFGFGESRPEAIREFLAYAYHHWTAPSPRYVVLLGDATFDFKDNYGTGIGNQIPPLILETRYLWTVSDPTYAAVNGEDLLPDLAIGRLPAQSVDEVRTLVEKILAYETGGASLEAPVVLVSDNPDEAGDFPAKAEALRATVLANRPTEHISLAKLGTGATRQAITDAFDQGPSVLSYIGHGGINLWANENLFDTSKVSTLSPRAQQPLLLTMNCLNGYFHFPFVDSLSEELVSAEGKGAIAAFSPSGMSLNGPAHLYHEALLSELFEGGHTRLGDAVLAAQVRYAETGAFPELLSIYHLLGDPALILPLR